MAMEDLFASIAKHNIELDKAYSFIVKDDRYECFGDRYFPEIENRKMAINFEPIPQFKAYYLPPEKEYLKQNKSLFQKLKNCWRYLLDDTGGRIVVEEEK
jgi:hypothetical protein